ncbi:MAG: VOC family protein, partial [Hyphomicrobiaceae bacterium]|nr:VOC family protein [Hyphomicrobiaceae bacterium]
MVDRRDRSWRVEHEASCSEDAASDGVRAMLTDLRVHTTIPVADMDRAMRWYEEKLNFKPLWKRPAGAM